MNRARIRGLGVHAVLIIGVLISIFPFYWIIVMATNTTTAIYRNPPAFWLGSQLFTNIKHVFANIDFLGSLWNTTLVSVVTTVVVLLVDSLAAFAFAKFDFPGKRFLFGLLLLLFMLPVQLALVPRFIIVAKLGLAGTLTALAVPSIANAFGIFWMRQYTLGAVPDELLDAVRMEGCGFFRQYWHVVLPCVRPAMSFLGIYTFINVWNDYIWPLVVLVDPNKLTLQVALAQLNVSHGTDYSMVMAGVLLGVLPLLVVFSLFARGFVTDATKGALSAG